MINNGRAHQRRHSVQKRWGRAGLLLLVPTILQMSSGCATTRVEPDLAYFPPPPSTPHVVHLKSFDSLGDLVPGRVSLIDALRGRTVGRYVSTPAGIDYHAGHLYICDTELNLVHDWNLETGEARRVGDGREITLVKPVAVAADDGGILYVADTGRGEVVAFGADGAVLRRLKPADRGEYRPVAVAVQGARIYATDLASHCVDFYSLANGAHLGKFGEAGTDPGQLYYPTGVATDSAGAILVSDMMNARVQVFDAEHRATLSMGQPGDRYGDMGQPKHVAIGPDGTVFIADATFAHVHLFNRHGQLLMLLGGPEEKIGGTPLPIGVTVAEQLPAALTKLVPDDFSASYFLFVSNSVGDKRMSLFAVGVPR